MKGAAASDLVDDPKADGVTNPDRIAGVLGNGMEESGLTSDEIQGGTQGGPLPAVDDNSLAMAIFSGPGRA